MVPLTGRIGSRFLGLNFDCVQCHDHPYDVPLKQRQFWGVNAYLRQVERVGTVPANPQMVLGLLELKDNPDANPDAVDFYFQEARRVGAY